MRGQLNEAMLAVMASIAHRLGLFEVLAALPPATSEAIAVAAKLDERYVREWLAAMVAGRIVDYDGVRETYALPPEHAACLTGSARSENLAAGARWIAALAQLEAPVAACFRSGDGLPAATFASLRELEAARAREDEAALVELVATRLPELAARLEQGIDVLHLRGTPTGSVEEMARRFPMSRYREERTIDRMAAPAYDLVTASRALDDHPRPALLLGAIHGSLRPGGSLLFAGEAASSRLADNLEHPLGPMLYATSLLRSLPASAAREGRALGLMWGEDRARRLLAEAGFGRVTASRMGGEAGRHCFLARKG
jgi:hypothetical protein